MSQDGGAGGHGREGAPVTPKRGMIGSIFGFGTPTRSKPQEPVAAAPRLKKKIPWNGKNIMVLLPRDDERGQPGMPPTPLNQLEVIRMLESWERLGYAIDGFDLAPDDPFRGRATAQSKDPWPLPADVESDRRGGNFKVALPDLNAWKRYEDELREAKLRALGVFLGDEPPPPSASTGAATTASAMTTNHHHSRQPSVQYPGLPFSPPPPPSSASSNPAGPFPASFSSAGPSPAVTARASPVPFGHNPIRQRFNPRQSMSISSSHSPFQPGSPHGWPLGHSRGSPSLMNFGAVMSPTSPFRPDHQFPAGGMASPTFNAAVHQRHQSMQFPHLGGHHQPSAISRSHSWLQEVREEADEEETAPKSLTRSPPGAPNPAQRNPDALQVEIDDAEYHLEEQLRNQLEHEDYSPHQTDTKGAESQQGSLATSAAEAAAASVPPLLPPLQSFPMPERFASGGTAKPPVLHHPRPHSRGHSLTQTFFRDLEDENTTPNGRDGKILPPVDELGPPKTDDAFEVDTNPSNLGTPVQAFDVSSAFVPPPHQRNFSTANHNPWNDAISLNGGGSGGGAAAAAARHSRLGHCPKPSISGLNVRAAEFKFNPASSFQPGKIFAFGGGGTNGSSSFPAPTFQGAAAPLSAPSSDYGPKPGPAPYPSGPSSAEASSMPGPAASAFAPSGTDFSFSSAGPKFRPNAPAFTPLHSGSNSVSLASPTSLIFAGIDLNVASNPEGKKSKAVPIVRPDSSDGPVEDEDDQRVHESRIKRIKSLTPADDPHHHDDHNHVKEETDLREDRDATPSLQPHPSDIPVESVESRFEEEHDYDDDVHKDHEDGDNDKQPEEEDDEADEADITLPAEVSILSSTAASEPTDTKPSAESPSVSSLEQSAVNWTPFEFDDKTDIQSFNDARPFGIDVSPRGHRKSFSAVANPSTPGDVLPSYIISKRGSGSEPADGSVSPITPTESGAFPATHHLSPSPSPSPPPQPPQGLAASRFSSPPLPPKLEVLAASRFVSPPPPPSPDSRKDDDAHEEAAEVELTAPGRGEEEPAGHQPTWSLYHADVEDHILTTKTGDDDVVEQEQEQDEQDRIDGEDEIATAAPGTADKLPSFDEIDAVMQHINTNDPMLGVNRTVDQLYDDEWESAFDPIALEQDEAGWRLDEPEGAPTFQTNMPHPEEPFVSDNDCTRQYHTLLGHPTLGPDFEDPFLDPPRSVHSFVPSSQHPPADDASLPASDWEGDFSEREHQKLGSRAQFFDGRVNDIVGSLLNERLGPLQHALSEIRMSISDISAKPALPTQVLPVDRRSTSPERQQSDADDEDDGPVAPRRSASTGRSRKVEQIKIAVMEALAAAQLRPGPMEPTPVTSAYTADSSELLLRTLQEMKEELGTSLRLDFRGEDLRNIVEEAVESRIARSPRLLQSDNGEDTTLKMDELQARVMDLEERLYASQKVVEVEVEARRAAQDNAADLDRKLQQAETRLEIEIMNRGAFDQLVSDLEDKVRTHSERNDEEVKLRRAAEDRLSEIQRLLRISSEEEYRLRALVEERDGRIRTLEGSTSEMVLAVSLLEAGQTAATQAQTELTNKMNATELELRQARATVTQLLPDLDRAREAARRHAAELSQVLNENKHLQKVLDTLGVQLQETERIRETWRARYGSLQDDLANARRLIAEEDAHRIRRDEVLRLRQEALEARLQAESKTRERLETEMERVEAIERASHRAVREAGRLDEILSEVRTENHHLQQRAVRAELAAHEARQAAAAEAERTRRAVATRTEDAGRELELQATSLRAEVDSVRLAADTARAQHEMLLEEALATGAARADQLEAQVRALQERHRGELEDAQARHSHDLGRAEEEAARNEQRLLERLSLSTAKSDHLQDRLLHVEEKLEIAREAAAAAAQRAKLSSASSSAASTTPADQPGSSSGFGSSAAAAASMAAKAMGLPEKISPQALRESIMVLQEQLQQREQSIEELEQRLAGVDPDAAAKLAKRDDEISWLRELLAVRHGDLQDLIAALSAAGEVDREAVREAAIRLRANLQMEEQERERERAMGGGSAVASSLVAQTIPRAQEIGSRVAAAAWGNWRNLSSSVLRSASPTATPARSHIVSTSRPGTATAMARTSIAAAAARSTPAKPSPSPQSFLGGLLTPPATGIRTAGPLAHQPTAFTSTGRRPSQQHQPQQQQPQLRAGTPSPRREVAATPPPREELRLRLDRDQPRTPPPPPMMSADVDADGYDSDAQPAGDFDDGDFFAEDD